MTTENNKISPLFTLNYIKDTLKSKKTMSNAELSIFENLFNKVDKEDLNGNLFQDGESDKILNSNEQSKLKQLLKNRYPKIYNAVSKVLVEFDNMTSNEILTHNIMLQNDWGLVFNHTLSLHNLKDINIENFMDMKKLHLRTPLLTKIAMDSVYADSKADRNSMILEKFNEFANYLLKKAKERNVYYKDFEKNINDTYEKKDLKYFAIAIDRLADRILIDTDKDKTITASKRAIELKDPNGCIDENFIQGYTGDCWFISALESICTDKNILDKVNKMIAVNKENGAIKSVTVNIQGKDYTIDYENIKRANEYSTGDMDVRALEMAINQFMHENDLGDIHLGGTMAKAFTYLFGKDNIEINDYRYDPEEYINNIKTLCGKDERFLSGISIGAGDSNKKLYAFDENGNKYELSYSHAYNYNKIDTEYLYFNDPKASNKELKMKISDFKNIENAGGTIIKFK